MRLPETAGFINTFSFCCLEKTHVISTCSITSLKNILFLHSHRSVLVLHHRRMWTKTTKMKTKRKKALQVLDGQKFAAVRWRSQNKLKTIGVIGVRWRTTKKVQGLKKNPKPRLDLESQKIQFKKNFATYLFEFLKAHQVYTGYSGTHGWQSSANQWPYWPTPTGYGSTWGPKELDSYPLVN